MFRTELLVTISKNIVHTQRIQTQNISCVRTGKGRCITAIRLTTFRPTSRFSYGQIVLEILNFISD